MKFTNLPADCLFYQLPNTHLAVPRQPYYADVPQRAYQVEYDNDKYNNHGKTPLNKVSNVYYTGFNTSNSGYY